MIPVSSVAIGLATLRVNPLRTVLSTLGVIIGVASLVAILALGDGLEDYARTQIETTTDLQLVTIDARLVESVEGMRVRRADAVILRAAQADSLTDAVGTRADVAIAMTSSAWYTAEGDTTRHPTLVTATASRTPASFLQTLEAGRFLTAADSAVRPVPAVLTPTLARQLGGAPASLLGRRLAIAGATYIVVGVAGGDPRGAARMIVPLTDAIISRFGDGGRQAPTILVKARRAEEVAAVQRAVENWLAQYGDVRRNFTIQSSQGRAAQARQGLLVFKLVMGSITGIAILVGGIGIMNIQLASVAERTREIGIRKAVGARRRDITLQFLAESVAIAGLGALLGVILGLAGAFSITAVIRRTTEARIFAAFTWGTVLVAATAAIVVGIAFGTYPARRAATLSPVEAIRHE
jgi:putative ABC transport system permease protein